MDKKIYQKIINKKEFSCLPKIDVEKAWKIFEKRQVDVSEKIRLTRDLLRKVFSAFLSLKLLKIKDKDPEWFLKKHVSTKERLVFYDELYGKILKDLKNICVFDLGAGVNGFSYNFFSKKVNYIAIESLGQLVDLQNYYFKTKGLQGRAFHESLFNTVKIKKLIQQEKKPKIVFLFKVVDSLEMLEKNYSKKFLKEVVPLVNFVVVSFATKSMGSRKNFKVKRYWFENFVKKEFKVLDIFELGDEKYFVFCKKQGL